MNNALADEIIGIINATPERHDNGLWVNAPGAYSPSQLRDDCGTVACVAGWAVILTASDECMLTSDQVIDPSYDRQTYSSLATAALGLEDNRDISSWLFYGSRSQEEILWGLKWFQDYPDATRCDIYENNPFS